MKKTLIGLVLASLVIVSALTVGQGREISFAWLEGRYLNTAGDTATGTHDFTGATFLSDVTVSVETADQGYAVFPVITYPQSASAIVMPSSPADEVTAVQAILPFQLKVSDIQVVVTTAAGGSKFGCGIYSADGNTLLLETGAVDSSSTGIKKATLGTAVTIPAGVYWYAQTTDSKSVRMSGVTFDSTWDDLFSDTVSQAGVAANSASSGVLPATLGTITFGANANAGFAYALMKP